MSNFKYNPNDYRPIEIQMIRHEVRERDDRLKKAGVTNYMPEPPKMFTIRRGDDWMQQERNTPAPRMLFGNFWYEGELCILFADTNMGKSILAVQIGDSISKAKAIPPFELQTERTNVLYIDFELSAKQFEVRNYGRLNGNEFCRNFFRAQFNPYTMLPPNYKDHQDYLNSAIMNAIDKTEAKVVIIDNISSLGHGTEYVGDALPLIKNLKTLKDKYQLSILVLAHTPKRHPSKPIGRNDLQGSKMLINFADSAFAIGQSQSKPGLRYLKQVKQRSSAEVYGANNVCMCSIDEQVGFLRYKFIGNGIEYNHLLQTTKEEHDHHLYNKAIELQAEGHSQRQIATCLNISLGKVNTLLKRSEDKGE